MSRVVSQEEFAARICSILANVNDCGYVTGPGRSGAVAAVYASHILHIPFIPFGSKAPLHLGRMLLIDTATESGQTLRKSARRYAHANPRVIACYSEPPRVMFWYEAPKPQFYRHEVAA